MQAKAKLRFLRMSPKKVRLIADLVRGLTVENAISQLNFINKAAKKPLLKLLNSAIANAENNLELKKDNLYIKEIFIDEAGSLKRWQPRAHGRATPIKKRMSNIILLLEEIKPTKQKVKKVKKAKKQAKPIKLSSIDEIKGGKKAVKDLEGIKEKSIPEGHDKEIDKEIHDVRLEGKHRHKQQEDKRQMKKKKGFIKKFFSRKAG